VKNAQPDAIMHFAANALVGESMANPKKYFHNNVVNALKFADAAVEAGVKKFVFSSTCATYGPPERLPMSEDLPQRPINPYGESTLMFEKILLWYQQIYGLEFVAFRYFNAAGASEKFGEHHRIETHLCLEHAGIVDDRSDRAERAVARFEQSHDVRLDPDVRSHGYRATTGSVDVVSYFVGSGGVPTVIDADVVAAGRGEPRRRRPDPAAGSGDQYDPRHGVFLRD